MGGEISLGKLNFYAKLLGIFCGTNYSDMLERVSLFFRQLSGFPFPDANVHSPPGSETSFSH